MTEDVPILVINLDRSPDRLASIATALEALGLPFVRLAGIDARTLRADQLAAPYDAGRNRARYFAPLHASEIACFLSHRAAWREIARGGAPFGVVFEDDARPDTRLPGVLAALAAAPADWDIVKLHGKSTRLARHLRALTDAADLTRPWVVTLGAAAYCVSRTGAEKLLAATEPFWWPVDVVLQHWWEWDLDVLETSPDVAVEAPFATGSTNRSGQRKRLPARLTREIRRPLFRLGLATRSILARLRG